MSDGYGFVLTTPETNQGHDREVVPLKGLEGSNLMDRFDYFFEANRPRIA